jgi:hypothetical protein
MTKIKAEWLTVFFTAIIAATGVWALIYASGQIREAREEAQVQHLLTLENEYKSEPIATYRKVCAQKRLAGVDEPDEEVEILNFFETVALLANHGYLKDADVWETFSYDIFAVYADDREDIEQDRKQDANDYANLMLLIPRLEAIEESRRGTTAKPSKEDVRAYWESEAKIGAGTPIGRHKHAQPATAPQQKGNQK